MAKMTIAKTFDFPFRRIGQKNGGESYYAVGSLRMVPLPAEAVEYVVDLPETAFAGAVKPSFAEAVGIGIKESAEANGIVGLRVALTAIEAADAGSSDYWFNQAAQSALEDAIKAHGVFAAPITVAEAFDLPFTLAKHDTSVGDWARGMLYVEPVPTAAVEFIVSLPEGPLPPDVSASFIAAVGNGVERSAQENGLVGLRVTLFEIEAHAVDSRNLSYEVAVSVAMRAAAKTQGIPVATKETIQEREKVQESSMVPVTLKRRQHTKETLKPVLVMLATFLIFAALTAWEWHTRLQFGYYYPAASFWEATFTAASAIGLVGSLLFPEPASVRRSPRPPEEVQARTRAALWKFGAVFAVCSLVGLLNSILISR